MSRFDSNRPPDMPVAHARSKGRAMPLAWNRDGALAADGDAADVSADLDYRIEEGTLRIHVFGPLDLRCVFRLLGIGRAVDDSIRECLIDLSGVSRVFDSGVAALVLFAHELTKSGVAKIRIRGYELRSASLLPYLT
ncbi:MAG: hypothetical protein EOM91_09030 [Sphingobacteriia bacterium]|nr:hypothetical protein [Sphingobacteriia bacterium]NCC38546.1 hypothetical protein [Gammaproteobacteria bacterium]